MVLLGMGAGVLMKTFYLTFGVQYAREVHPSGSHVHPDGYVVIKAPEYDIARDLAVQLYGKQWSDLYGIHDIGTWELDLFPRGVLLTIEVPE